MRSKQHDLVMHVVDETIEVEKGDGGEQGGGEPVTNLARSRDGDRTKWREPHLRIADR